MINTSKYYRKFQDGGDIQNKLVALVLAAVSGDQLAVAQILQIQQAAELGDPQATQLMQMVEQIMQQLQSLGEETEVAKKGTKIKRACGGKWLQGGGIPEAKSTLKEEKIPIKKNAKGGKPCGCKATLHKVGGKIIEICI